MHGFFCCESSCKGLIKNSNHLVQTNISMVFTSRVDLHIFWLVSIMKKDFFSTIYQYLNETAPKRMKILFSKKAFHFDLWVKSPVN